ncbi:MAG: class I SAM-dependent methyltransferase [Candidatus Korarchaeum sp.]
MDPVGIFDVSLARYMPEGIPYPLTRAYSSFARSRIMRDFYRKVAEEVAFELSCRRILDIGTGPGYLPLEVAKLVEGAEVVGIDISEDMIRIARRNAEREILSERVEFLAMDANNMSFRNSSFDLVLSTGSLHHWKRPLQVLSEIRRVLKEGGQAWIYDLRRDAPRELIAAKLREYGYGGAMSSILSSLVRLHSGTSLGELMSIVDETRLLFRGYSIEEDWCSFPVLKLKLFL